MYAENVLFYIWFIYKCYLYIPILHLFKLDTVVITSIKYQKWQTDIPKQLKHQISLVWRKQYLINNSPSIQTYFTQMRFCYIIFSSLVNIYSTCISDFNWNSCLSRCSGKHTQTNTKPKTSNCYARKQIFIWENSESKSSGNIEYVLRNSYCL